MQKYLKFLPFVLLGLITLAFAVHGAIPQLDHYHEFADQSQLFGLMHASDVLSNLAFLWVGLWAVSRMLHMAESRDLKTRLEVPALVVFVLSIVATAWCSSYYHLAPDNPRLFWDRLPIAVACASLLALVRAQCFGTKNSSRLELLAFCGFAVFSVIWWQATEDLRPYLLLQIMAVLLPPIWQSIYQRAVAERMSFAAAIVCYVVAKLFETADATILNMTGVISGHTLKHLLAALAAYFILRPLLTQAESVTPS